MNATAFSLGAMALGFTIFAFYWMNWRAGRLVATRPRSFATLRSDEGLLAICLPLVLVNTGARPVIVQNLRLLFPDATEPHRPFVFNSVADSLSMKATRHLASQFAVLSREPTSCVCEFERSPAALCFESRPYNVELEAIVGDEDDWQHLVSFELRIPSEALTATNAPGFIAIDNEVHRHLPRRDLPKPATTVP